MNLSQCATVWTDGKRRSEQARRGKTDPHSWLAGEFTKKTMELMDQHEERIASLEEMQKKHAQFADERLEEIAGMMKENGAKLQQLTP